MPNHVHAIVYIKAQSNEEYISDKHIKTLDTSLRSPQKGSLAVVIRGIKSATTLYAHQNQIDFNWQPRYYDHIIRDWYEMNYIADYIEAHPKPRNFCRS